MNVACLHALIIYLSLHQFSCETEEATIEASDEKQMESVFGDIGDEVFTNLPIRKSSIPNSSNNTNGDLIEKYTKEERTTTRILKPYDHFINPLFYRDFIATKDHKPKQHNNIRKKSYIDQPANSKQRHLSDQEIVALNNLHKHLSPSSVHVEHISKKSTIAQALMRAHAIQLAKSLRSSPKVSASVVRDTFFNSDRRHYYPRKLPMINQVIRKGRPQPPNLLNRLSYAALRQPKSPMEAAKILQIPHYNSFFQNGTIHKIGELLSARKQSAIFHKFDALIHGQREIPSLSTRRNLVHYHVPAQFKASLLDPKSNFYLHKAWQYKNNSLLHDLSKVTMQWTGYKALEAIKRGKSGPEWLAFLKSAMQPKRFKLQDQKGGKQNFNALRQKYNLMKHQFNPSLHFMKGKSTSPVPKVIESFADTNILFDKRKSVSSTKQWLLNMQRPSTLIAHKRKMKTKEKEDEEKKKKKKKEPTQKIINIYPTRPPPDDCCPQQQQYQYLNYQNCCPQSYQPTYQNCCPEQQSQQPVYSNCCLEQQPTKTNYLNCCPQQPQLVSQQQTSIAYQPQPATYTEPGVIPYNYFHSEKTADGRVRPALYPIAHHLHGKCLPESSLCDKGRHEQCCGATTLCVDYWGISKCLAFRQNTAEELFNPYQMRNNLNYKNYYKFLESSI